MGITVYPPSTSSGGGGGSEKPYKCIPACGAVSEGDLVSLIPGECVVRSAVKGADQDCFTCFCNGNGTTNTTTEAWNVAVPFLCANNCYANVIFYSGVKCTDSFSLNCWRCPCIRIDAITVNSDQSTTCCTIYSCCILLGTETWTCYNGQGECCCAWICWEYAPIVLPSCSGSKTAIFMPKGYEFLRCNANTCKCNFFQQEIWLCYCTTTGVVSVICNCCNIEGIGQTATNFCKCDNFYYMITNDRKYLFANIARGYPNSPGSADLKNCYVVKCLNDNSYLGLTAATVTGFNPCCIWCNSTCCIQYDANAGYGAFGWAPFSQGQDGWMLARFTVDRNPQTANCCCYFNKMWAVKPTGDCAITMSTNIICDVDSSCNLETTRTGFWATKNPCVQACRHTPNSNAFNCPGHGRVFDEGDCIKKISIPTFDIRSSCCLVTASLACFCIDALGCIQYLGGQSCHDGVGARCCSCGAGNGQLSNGYLLGIDCFHCRFYATEPHASRCDIAFVSCEKGGAFGGNLGPINDTHLYYNSYPTCPAEGKYRTALSHHYIHGGGRDYNYALDTGECVKVCLDTNTINQLVCGTDGQCYRSASEYKFCACTTCWNLGCNAHLTKIIDGVCAGDRTPANNFFHPSDCCLAFTGGFLPLGSSTTAFITSQGPSHRGNNWCSETTTGVRMWSQVFHKDVKKSTLSRAYGIAQNSAADGEIVCIARQGNIDKSSFTCTYLIDSYNSNGAFPQAGGLCCGNIVGWLQCKCTSKHTRGSGGLHSCYMRGYQQSGCIANCSVRCVWITPYYDATEQKIVGKLSSRGDNLDDL